MEGIFLTITDKARKMLWGRSGSRCTICRTELVVDATSKDPASLVGEECHIISGKKNGPRYNPNYPMNEIDSYDNLLLLCRVHHKMVDDQFETYSADILRSLKANHEKWVTERLSGESPGRIRIKRVKENIPDFLTRVNSGNYLMNIVEKAYAFSFGHDELELEEEVCLIGDFLQSISDLGNILSDLEPTDKVRIGFELTQQLKSLEQQGFYVFGAIENRVIEGGKEKSTNWPVALLRVIRKESEGSVGL